MTIVYASLGPLVQRCAARVEVGLTRTFQEAGSSPKVYAVLGRVGTGKSTFVNRVIPGAGAATGLGGRTREPRRYEAAGLALWDLPGRGGDHEVELAWASEVDGVVWVTDALQPWGAEERRAAAEIPVPWWVALGRLDLVDPEEREEVLARVRALARGARGVERADAPEWRSWLLDLPVLASPRRREAVRRAALATEAALGFLPLPPAPAEVAAARGRAWRARVEGARKAVEARVRTGELVFGEDVRRSFEAALGADAPPSAAPGVWRQLGELARGTPGLLADLTVWAAERAASGEIAALAWADGPEGKAAAEHRAAELALRADLRSLCDTLAVSEAV